MPPLLIIMRVITVGSLFRLGERQLPNRINIYVKPPFFAIYIIEILKFI